MNDQERPSFYDLLSDTPSSDRDTPLNVLLHVLIDNPPDHGEHSLDHSFPLGLSSFLESPTHAHSPLQHDPSSSTGAGMSIDSLLAASQQLAAPEHVGARGESGSDASNSVDHRGGGPSSSGRAPWNASYPPVDDFAAQLQQFVSPQPPTPRPDLEVDLAVHPDLQRLQPSHVQLHAHPQPQPPPQQQPDEHLRKRPKSKPKPKRPEKSLYLPIQTLALAPGVKRKWDDVGVDERRAKIRKAIEANAIKGGNLSPTSLSTILCLHASAAQKSYGTEKRYLCPPPMVRIEGPIKALALKPKLQMTVMSETREAQVNERANVIEPHMRAFFRGLHVGGATAKGKSFGLELTLHTPPEPSKTHTELEQLALEGQPEGLLLPPAFAAFDSSDIAVISKPSKKTAKARNTTSCIFAGSTICLHNRINSQTVRTKYMAVEDGQLCARQSQWTAFSIHVLRRDEDTFYLASSKIPNGELTVTYGSEVLLTDLMTGISSEPLVVRKVEKKRVMLDATGPVSQLQKLAFSRVVGGRTMYLSAAPDGMDSLGNELKQSSTPAVPETGKKRKREEDFNDDDAPTKPVLTYQSPKRVVPAILGGDPESHEVDDLHTWTVTGINSFSYSYFDAFAGPEHTLPTACITPFPTVSAPPEYHAATHSVSFNVTNFFSLQAGSNKVVPLEVWVGPIGPLKVHVIEASGAIKELTMDTDNSKDSPDDKDSQAPEVPVESLLSIELPSIDDMIKASRPPELSDSTFEELLAGAQSGGSTDFQVPSAGPHSHSFLDRSYAALADSLNVATDVQDYESSNSELNDTSHTPFASTPRALPLHSPTTLHASVPTHAQTVLPALPDIPRPASLPLIFVRPSDGIGYMSQRWVVAEQEPLNDQNMVAALLDRSVNGAGSAPWGVRIV